MLHSTLKQTLSDSLWGQDLDRQNRYIAAQNAGRVLAEQAGEVLATHTFARDDAHCFYSPQGACVQCGMTLTDPDTNRSVTVVCKLDDRGDQFWFITDVGARAYSAAVYIAAVKARIARNTTGRSGTGVAQ